MFAPRTFLVIAAAAALSAATLSGLLAQGAEPNRRPDGAEQLPIKLDGSLQNAAWSPDGKQIVFTRFRRGYNRSPADLFIFEVQTRNVTALIDDGKTNVSQPGSTWNARTGRIVFSSTRTEHDQVFSIASQGKADTLKQLTSSDRRMAYEPSMSPDGQAIVFESHVVDEEGNGSIRMLTLSSPEVENLTDPDEDCRQPNWSPAGDLIVYQKKDDGQWDLWLYEIRSKQHRRLTQGDGDKTDATFSPDGRWVLYSADNSDLKHAALFATSVDGQRTFQVTNGGVYDGAASWSPDGKTIVFESAAERPLPPGVRGWILGLWERMKKAVARAEASTQLWKIATPDVLVRQLCLGGTPCR
jgi:TolB protein